MRRAAALVALEGAALAVVGVVFALRAATGEPDDRSGSIGIGLLALAAGLALLPVARGLDQVRTWPWAPAILAQVLIGVIAVGALQGGLWVVAVPLGLLAGTVLYQLATPEARLAHGGG